MELVVFLVQFGSKVCWCVFLGNLLIVDGQSESLLGVRKRKAAPEKPKVEVKPLKQNFMVKYRSEPAVKKVQFVVCTGQAATAALTGTDSRTLDRRRPPGGP
nr:hypothetical protein BaRGS_024390 [Batillaria attramentaria]